MEYNKLYQDFKERISEGKWFYEVKEKECSLDETDGMHVVFGMVVVPYLIWCKKHNDAEVLQKIFLFMEDMSMCEDVKVREVLDFTILEQLIDQERDLLIQYKRQMGVNTRKHCDEIEKYFF